MLLKRRLQLTGAVLNMSHFLCPGSTTPHYIFGPPTSFLSTCAELSLDVLAQIPIEPAVSSQGDKGAPVVMMQSNSSSTAFSGGGGVVGSGKTSALGEDVGGGETSATATARGTFLNLAEKVWRRVMSV